MSNQDIERVARAIFANWREQMIKDGEDPDQVATTYEALSEPEKIYALGNARAAIAAMREPSEAMLRAGKRAMGSYGAHDCEVPASEIWKTMIDEALK